MSSFEYYKLIIEIREDDMDIDVLKLGGDCLIETICKTFFLDSNLIKLISATENFVYQYSEKYILRVSPITHRSFEEVSAELEWIEFLNKNDINACRAISKRNNKRINFFEYNGIIFIAVFFEYAKGENILNKLSEKAYYNVEQFYKLWGSTLGKMHAIAKKYIPKDTRYIRKQWNEVIPQLEREEDIKKYAGIIVKQKKIISYLDELPRDINSYGMIHSDFNYYNFFVCDSNIFCFDFDHCKYHWFVYDIAIVLDSARYIIGKVRGHNMRINQFFDCFMEGYLKYNTLTQFWLNQIPEFTKLWSIDNFIPIINKVDYDKMEIWEKRMLSKMQYNIENEIPYYKLN